jgi:hypothetical protein
MGMEMAPTAREAADDISPRHIMSSLPDTGSDATQCQLQRRQAQENDFDSVTSGFPASQPPEIKVG